MSNQRIEKTNRFPNGFIIGNLTLKKISAKNDDTLLMELLNLYKSNRKHLFYWHHGIKQLLFKNVLDIVKRMQKNRLICYAIYDPIKIVGYVEITRLEKDEKGKKCRSLSFWIDKNNVRKGIMQKCLTVLEKHLLSQGVDNLCAEVDMANIPSINLLEKLGYKRQAASFLISGEGKTILNTFSYQKTISKEEK
jgi:RimJ/RimL family protein N-acetyltransferase